MSRERGMLRHVLSEDLSASALSHTCSQSRTSPRVPVPPGRMTGNPKIRMRWNKPDFDREIGGPYGLDLIGWPVQDNVPFTNCSRLQGGNRMFRDLMGKWENGSLYFKQTCPPMNLLAVGALVRVPRYQKTRCDIKTTPQRVIVQQPEGKSRKQIKAGPKSVPVIESSDAEADGGVGACAGQKRSCGGLVKGREQKRMRTVFKSIEVIEDSDIEVDEGKPGSCSVGIVDSDPIEDWSD